MSIEQLIPKGSSNAISRENLSYTLNMKDREIRRQIQEARMAGIPIISTSHARGYFVAENDSDIDIFEHECLARTTTIMQTSRRVRKAWNEREQVSMEVPE